MKIRFNQPEQKIADDDRGVRIQYGEAKRPGRPWRWYLILLVASLPLFYLLGLVVWEIISVKASGRINVPLVTVRSSSEGFVQKILVEPLQEVTKGAELALLSNALLENNLDRLQGEVDFLDKERDKLKLGVNDNSSGSKQLLHFARQQRNFYHKRMHQYETLFEQGAATQAETATARNQYAGALGSLASLESAQRLGKNLEPEIRQMDARINQLTLELAKTQDQRDQLLLIAPATGLITELFVQPGEYLDQGQRLLDIMFPEQAHITAFIPPKYQDYAFLNQLVTVEFPNGEKAQAKIIAIPGVTQKSSTEDLGPLETPRASVLAKLEFTSVVKTRLVNGLPVDIYFDYFSK